MGRTSVPKKPTYKVSIHETLASVLEMGELAEQSGGELQVAWRPVWCAGSEIGEDGVKRFHHFASVRCKCPPGPQIQALWADADEVALLGGRGSAKGQPMWAKVLTPRGWAEMRDIKVGTQICNPDGTLAKVIQIHPLGVKKIFRVTTSDGGVTHVTDDHRWLAKLTMRNPYKAECKYYPFGDNDGVNARIYTTEFLAKHLEQERDKNHRLRSNVLIPLTKPTVCFKHAKSKPWETVHPYLIGVLIGDGCLTQSVRFSSADPHIVDRVTYFNNHGKVVDDEGYNYRIASDGALEKELQKLGLYGKPAHEKSIPDGYLWAPVEQRLELLRGLMDTDGSADKQGHLSYCTTSEQLAKDVKHLVESLGGRVSTSKPTIGRYKKDGETIDCRVHWKLYIQAPRPSEFFSLPRKKALCRDIFNGGVSELQRRIVSIEYVGDEEAQCISVDHPNQLYITDDHIVTHNSEATFGFLLKGNFKPTGHPCDVTYVNHPDYRFLVLRSTSEDLEEYFTRFKQIAEPMGGHFTENPRRCKFPSGAEGLFFHMGDDTWRKAQGRSFVRIVMEEATHVGEKVLIEFIKANRTKHEKHMKCQIMLTANPNGPGLAWVNARYRYPMGGSVPLPSNKVYTCPYTGRTRVYIHSTADDNPYFLQGSASYIKALDSLKTHDETEYRRMRLGDFDCVEGAFFCCDEDTDILTSSGFKPICSVEKGEMVATMPPSGEAYFAPCSEAVSFEYDGDMIECDQKMVNFKVTPNHRMYCEVDNNNGLSGVHSFIEAQHLTPRTNHVRSREFVDAGDESPVRIEWTNLRECERISVRCTVCGSEFETKGRRPKATCSMKCTGYLRGRFNGGYACKYTAVPSIARGAKTVLELSRADYCALLGWYIAEGCLAKNNKYGNIVSISQQDPPNAHKVREIASLLDRLGLSYKYKDNRFFRIYSKALYNHFLPLGRSHEKYIPEWVFSSSKKCLLALFNALIDGDGHRSKSREGGLCYFTTSKKLAGDVQRLAVLLGYGVNLSPRNREHWQRPGYWLGITQNHAGTRVWGDRLQRVHYKGKVGCVTVEPHHTILIRRQGKLLWTGNSGFRKQHRESEPENALHVVKPFNLAPWWPRAIGLDWGYSHPAGAVFACWTPQGQLVLYREMKVSKMTPKEVGAELARKAFKDLEGLPSKHMMVYLSHDAFHRESGPTSEADQIAEGIGEVLGADAAFVYAPNEDEKTLAPEAAWASVRQRQASVGNKVVLTLVPAGGGNKRRMGYNLMRDYMRWTPLVEKQFDEQYAAMLMQREGALAYAKYKIECDKAAQEKLPVLQIFSTLPHLIQEIEAMQEDPKNTEQPLKQDGDDLVDAGVHVVANFRRTEEDVPRDVQIQMKMQALHPSVNGTAKVMAARHWESELGSKGGGSFSLPRAAGPTRRHWMAGRVN